MPSELPLNLNYDISRDKLKQRNAWQTQINKFIW